MTKTKNKMTVSDNQRQLVITARITGIWYLIMAISGVLGFMIFHPQIFVSGDPEKTLANLINLESLSRIRLLFELTIVVAQALTAVWFYKLFRNIDDWGAWAVGIWGMMNSAAIMISAISMASVIEVANSPDQTHDDKIMWVQFSGHLIKNAWGIGSLFFGLWLIPMGYIVTSSKRMPAWLGRTLIVGGTGYLLSTFIKYTGFVNPLLEILVIPATVGEFWMIGYLLIYGIRPLNEQKDVAVK